MNTRRKILASLLLAVGLVFGTAVPASADAIRDALELHKWKLMVTSGMLASVTAPETIRKYYTLGTVPGVGADGLLSAGSDTYELDMERWNNRPSSSYYGHDAPWNSSSPDYSPEASKSEARKAGVVRTALANAYQAPATIAQRVRATASNIGILTPTQLQELKSKTRIPVAAAAGLVRGVGGAVTALSGYSMGAQLGAGTVTMFGIDPNDAVCSSVDSGGLRDFLNVATGTDCAPYDWVPDFVPNADVVIGINNLCRGIVRDSLGTGTQLPSAPDCRTLTGLGRQAYTGPAANAPIWQAAGYVRVDSIERATPTSGLVTLKYTTAYDASLFPSFNSGAVSVWCFDPTTRKLTTAGYSGSLSVSPVQQTRTFTPTCASYAVYLGGYLDAIGNGAGTLGNQIGTLSPVKGNWVFFSGQAIAEDEITSADPDRYLECSVTGTDGIVYTEQSEYYKESGAAPVPVCPELPAGVFPANTTVTENGGSTPGVIYDEPSSEAFLDAAEKYPDCLEFPCALDLLLKATGESCFDLDTRCDGWRSDAERESKYQCSYGAYNVPLFECNVYATTFNFDLRNGGQPYADPATGLPVGVPIAQTAHEQMMGSGVMPPDGARNCWPTGWGAVNPLAWIYTPVRCVLEWAFVPRVAAVKYEVASLGSGWAGTAPGTLLEAAEGWEAELPELEGCEGPPVRLALEWPLHIDHTMYPLWACDGPGEIAAGLSRMLSSIAMIWGATRAITWYLGRTFGYGGIGAA